MVFTAMAGVVMPVGFYLIIHASGCSTVRNKSRLPVDEVLTGKLRRFGRAEVI
jgi:hypothetical protein